jgi:predicted ATPase/DNA-binding CsgD family transcriptional regulator
VGRTPQLNRPGLPGPLAVPALPALPAQLTAFVGRRAELGEIAALLGDRRLVTITGPGGSGKTRLALETLTRRSGRWADGARWVDLGPVASPGRVAEVAAAAVGVLVDPAIGAVPALAGHLVDREVALCFDNCEHLVEACADVVGALLRTCPGVTVLATSREPLGVPGEAVWRVPPMAEGEAVALFGDRARLVRPGFGEAAATDAADPSAAVRTVCRRLDGMPLAIELAAAWVRMLSPAQIADALDDRFRLLVGGPRGAIPRQQTLAASVDWSHGLLRDDARTLLRRLSVFSGGFALDAAEAVCGFGDLDADDVLGVLGGLVDSSMVVVSDRDGFARYRLLETIRDYAADRLAEAGESEAAADRHLGHFLALAESTAAALDRGDQDALLAELEREHDNLRAALAWGLSRPDPARGRRVAVALTRLWLVRGHAHTGLQLLRAAIDAAPDDTSTVQADLLSGLAVVAAPAGRIVESAEVAARAVELAEAAGDDRTLGRAYAAATYLPFYTDYPRAEELARRAQRHADAAGDVFPAEWARLMEGCSYMNRERHDEAVAIASALHERSLARDDRFLAAFSLSLVMHAAVLTGDVRRGVEVGTLAVEICEPLHDYFTVGTNTVNLAWALGVAGRVDEGWRLVEPVVRTISSAGPDVDVVGIGPTVGRLKLWGGDVDGAVESLDRASRFGAPPHENWITVRTFPVLSDALRRAGRTDDALAVAEHGVEVGRRLGTHHATADSLDALARLVSDADPGRAEDLHHEALALRVEHGLDTDVADSLDALALVSVSASGSATTSGSGSADRLVEAARLLGAADTARARAGYPRLAIDRSTHAAFVASLAEGLGEPAFSEARAAGAELSLADAVAYAARSRGPRRRPTIGWASLTPAEHQVVALVVEGLTNPEIAARLFVSRATVKTHLSHIYAKLGIANRTELAAAALPRLRS